MTQVTHTTVEGLRNDLQAHFVSVDFTKKDGTTRHMEGTTIPTYLDKVENLTDDQKAARSRNTTDSGDLVTLWEVGNGWRSFHFSDLTGSSVQANA